MTALQITWYFLIAAMVAIYAVLDGFDLGVGIIYPFTRGEEKKQKLLKIIGPFWDGNEVWLLAAGGALFAAFPRAYATLFSALYLPLVLVILGLILRAVSLEFRNKRDFAAWRSMWDAAFFIGSLLPAFLLGVAAGNIFQGFKLDSNFNFTGSVLDLLNLKSILFGIFAVIIFAIHGICYKAMSRLPFILSSLFIILVAVFIAAFLFPNIIISAGDPSLNLNVANASASHLSLKAMLIVAAIGMPLVVGYNIWIYRLFKEKREVGSASS